MDRSNGTYWVIKQMDLNTMSGEETRLALQEGKILESLDHPNITAFKEVYKSTRGKLCIVMEYCDMGNLDEFTKKLKKAENGPSYLEEELIWDYFT